MSRLPRIADRRRAPAMALVALCGIAQAVAAGAAAFATRDVFAALNMSAVLPVTALMVLLSAGAIVACLRIVERTLAEWIGQHYAATLRHRLFRHLSRLSPKELTRRRSGSLALRFVGDLSTVRTWVSLGIARIISAVFVLPGAIAALWLLNPYLAVAGAATLAGAFVLMAIVQRFLAPLHRQLRGLRAKIAADMSERAPVAAELRLQGRDDLEARRLDKTARNLRRAALKRTGAAAGLSAIPEIALAATGVLFLALAFRLNVSGAEIAAALAVLGILAVPMNQLAVIWDRRRAWQVARDKCLSLLDLPLLQQQPASVADNPAGGLEFEAVCGQQLSGVTGQVRCGQSVAVLGSNGAGKSTLLTMVAGLDVPTGGRITLNGLPVGPNQVCYVGARSPILRGSLRRALTMGLVKRPGDKKIIKLAKSFGLGPLLKRLGGLDGRVAEAGRNLSSGEARRVHLVRAGLSKAPVLLLDEPDDALDPEGRQLVAGLIENSRAITVCVTHDLVLARMVDQVWFVADGQIQAKGKFATLVSQPGPVRDFARPNLAA